MGCPEFFGPSCLRGGIHAGSVGRLPGGAAGPHDLTYAHCNGHSHRYEHSPPYTDPHTHSDTYAHTHSRPYADAHALQGGAGDDPEPDCLHKLRR